MLGPGRNLLREFGMKRLKIERMANIGYTLLCLL
jgi:hypothetical protein